MLKDYRLKTFTAPHQTSDPKKKVELECFFWSTNPKIVSLRKTFLWQWFLASIELWILIFLMSTLYLGTGHNPSRYTVNLDVAIVDLDHGLAAQYFLQSFQQTPAGNLTLGWRYRSADTTTDDDVRDGHVWVMVILQPNTTLLINNTLSLLANSTSVIESPFAKALPITVIYEEGRNSFTINNYALPAIKAAIAKANGHYGQYLRNELIQNLSSSAVNSSVDRSLQLLNTFQLASFLADPLMATYVNLHPASPFVGQLASTLAYIYLYLITGMVVGANIRFVSTLVGKIHRLDLMLYRILNGTFQTFMIALIFSLIVLWLFDIDSGSLFMRYWMFNWLAAMVFGMVIVLFTVNLGRFANSLLIIFVILMLAGATLQISLELSPPFYRYGYGLPLYHILNGGRHLLFGSHSRFALDVGVLLIYYGVIWICAAITSVLWIKKEEKQQLEKAKSEAH